MALFRYSGPLSGATLSEPGGTSREVMFFPGAAIDLPADNQYIRDLVEQGYLTPIQPPVQAETRPSRARK